MLEESMPSEITRAQTQRNENGIDPRSGERKRRLRKLDALQDMQANGVPT